MLRGISFPLLLVGVYSSMACGCVGNNNNILMRLTYRLLSQTSHITDFTPIACYHRLHTYRLLSQTSSKPPTLTSLHAQATSHDLHFRSPTVGTSNFGWLWFLLGERPPPPPPTSPIFFAFIEYIAMQSEASPHWEL